MFSNTHDEPTTTVEVVVGLDQFFNFMDVTDHENPKRLNLDLTERCLITFRLENKLLAAGWRFQAVPITFDNDWGQNFSSFYWVDYPFQGEPTTPYAQFKLIYEAKRMGIFIYSLFMHDGLGQPIDLDPKIENGVGH